MTAMEFFTIGVYNSAENVFFEKLARNKIDTFCDIRQRRGVRGAKYSFVNSSRLQQKLDESAISYIYIRDLAPTAEIRELQKSLDIEKGELKRERKALSDAFVKAYKSRIIGSFDFGIFFEQLEVGGAKKIALFCVEELAGACHRSIVAEKLAVELNYSVTHL